MLTEYDIQRLSAAIVDRIANDDKVLKRIAKAMPRQGKLVSSSVAASILGVTRKTVCEIAPFIGGVRGDGKSAHWMFQQEDLIEKYKNYKMMKQ